MPASAHQYQGFCRNCLAAGAPEAIRCDGCGSPRLLQHAELASLTMAHIDCDAFYAAVEKRDRPELADKPVIVGGGKRGVVMTACYVARIRGVRSAMPMYTALKLCPDAAVVPPDMDKYVTVGRQVRQLMEKLTPLVEPLSIDEAFLDLSGTEHLHHAPPAELLARLALQVEAELGITVSIGLSFNKFLAKLASDFDKPRGFRVIGREEAVRFLAKLPVGRIWGVGPAMQRKLDDDGIRLIGQLQAMDEDELVRRYGAMGERLARLSRAEDSRRINPRGEAKSVSADTTFESDIADGTRLNAILRRLAERVSASLKKQGLAGRTVTLKIRTPDFKTRTRSRTLPDPTQLADRIWRTGSELLAADLKLAPFRLIGVAVSQMAAIGLADPPDLVDVRATRRATAERTMDAIRDKFGAEAVELGLTVGQKRGRSMPDRTDWANLPTDRDET